MNNLRTEDQHADIPKKVVARERFEKHRDFSLGIYVFRPKKFQLLISETW